MEALRTDWVLADEAESVGRARALISRALTGLPDEEVEIVVLLASELVTNAICHASGPVAVHLHRDEDGVRVEIEDRSPEKPVLRALDDEALDGRGLLLVDRLATGWGVQPRGPGKAVWFTLDG